MGLQVLSNFPTRRFPHDLITSSEYFPQCDADTESSKLTDTKGTRGDIHT